MTQHKLPEHSHEDRQIMRRLALAVGGFLATNGLMAIVITITMG
ncbi:MAG: hypothetical protein ACI9NT_000835 [Bacteroidia bacterium]|jgi:hypothetical protein